MRPPGEPCRGDCHRDQYHRQQGRGQGTAARVHLPDGGDSHDDGKRVKAHGQGTLPFDRVRLAGVRDRTSRSVRL